MDATKTKPRVVNDTYLDSFITEQLLAQRLLDKDAHVSSGKLSASSLSYPLQWQILKVIGVPGNEPDEYTLRKFLRGNHVEEWLVGHMPGMVEAQKDIEYKNVVGFVDAIVDTKDWRFPVGVIPHEVKSVSNLKYKRIMKEKAADPQHRLQATVYALALGSEHYAIDYVASDDYRVYTFVYDVTDTVEEVHTIIDTFNQALGQKTVPLFEPRYTWQANEKYNNYPEWMDLYPAQIEEKLQQEFPACYKKLKGLV